MSEIEITTRIDIPLVQLSEQTPKYWKFPSSSASVAHQRSPGTVSGLVTLVQEKCKVSSNLNGKVQA